MDLIMFLDYAFDLLLQKNIKGFGEQILHTFQALSNCTRIWAFLEKVLRFAGFEEPKLQL